MAGLANLVKNEKNLVTDAYQQVAVHNMIYRGKVLVDTTGGSAPYTLAQLHSLVSAGNFSDIYVGDEIRVTIDSATVRFIVMAIDWYINSGDGSNQLTSHHLVLVPKNALGTAQMNTSNVTTNGVQGSAMFTTNLPPYATKISTALGGYLLTWRSICSNAVTNGAASGWAWFSTNCRLLSEVDVYGFIVWGNGYDVGESNRQLPGFAMNPDLLIKGVQADGRGSWWLFAVSSSATFALVNYGGDAGYGSASDAAGVVPKVLFG